MPNDNAGVADTEAASDQKTDQVSTEKSSASVTKPNVSEDAKPQEKVADISKEDGEKKEASKSDEKTEKPEPFHRHPAFQRLNRKNAKLSAEVSSIKEQNTELVGLVKELMALTKGEEYKPEKVENSTENFDSEELLDMEMDEFIQSTNLSENEENEVFNLSKELFQVLKDGTKVYMHPSVAYQVYQKLKGNKTSETSSGVSEKKMNVPTRPSPRANEKSVSSQGEGRPPARDLYEAIWRAKATLEKYSSS